MPKLIPLDMKADIKGIISGLSLSEDKVLFPVFEAVVNSIQAIDERKKNENIEGEINIKIIRYSKQTELGDSDGSFEKTEVSSPISSIEIVDNGIGLNSLNFGSFNTAHSTKKIKIGGKGLGRFSMLSVFEDIEIQSTFLENGELSQRKVKFTDESIMRMKILSVLYWIRRRKYKLNWFSLKLDLHFTSPLQCFHMKILQIRY